MALKRISLAASAILLVTATPSLAQKSWVDNNLSVDCGKVGEVFLPLPTGDWGSNQQHVNYFTLVNNQWHVAELLYNGTFWQCNDLTATAINGTAAAPGSAIHRYWTNCCDQHVNFVDGNGHVHELYITFSNPPEPWKDNDLKTAATHGTAASAGSALAGYSSGGDQHVVFIDGNNHLHELFKTPGANWYDTDLTQALMELPPHLVPHWPRIGTQEAANSTSTSSTGTAIFTSWSFSTANPPDGKTTT
jgi:hypothetical protein